MTITMTNGNNNDKFPFVCLSEKFASDRLVSKFSQARDHSEADYLCSEYVIINSRPLKHPACGIPISRNTSLLA